MSGLTGGGGGGGGIGGGGGGAGGAGGEGQGWQLGGGGGVAAGAAGGGLCVFTCSTFFSAIGAIAALMDYDLGPESAFFAVNGLGALCFAKCQYLRLAEEKSRVNMKQHWSRNDWDPSYNNIGQNEGGYANGVRKRREDTPWNSYSQNHSYLDDRPNKKGKKAGKSNKKPGTIF